MDKILPILDNHCVLESTLVDYRQMISINCTDQKQLQQLKRQRWQIKGPQSLTAQKILHLKEDLQKEKIKAEISKSVSVGSKLSQYKNLFSVYDDMKEAQIVHKKEQVLLIDVWATWCGPCQKPMDHNQKMLTDNEQKWKDKVRIVGVSVDDDANDIKQRVDSKGWNRIQHLTLKGWNNQHPLVADFNLQGIPFVVLVDKFGIISYKGHPSQVNLQQLINNLLTKEQDNLKKQDSQGSQKSLTKIASQREKINSKWNQIIKLNSILNKQALSEQFKNYSVLNIECSISFSQGLGQLINATAQLFIATSEDAPQVIEKFKTLTKGISSELLKITERLIVYEKINHPQNPQCADCHEKLEYPFYWCKWQEKPNTFRCRKCIQSKPEKEGHHYKYLQNSIYLPGKWQKVAKKGLGQNIQPKDIKQIENPNMFGCNGCGTCPQDIGVARYICLVCKVQLKENYDYIDLCQECFIGYANKDQDKVKTINVQGHNSNHPLLRILYNVKNYYEY